MQEVKKTGVSLVKL